MKLNKNDKKAAKAGLWYTFSNFFTKGALYLSTPFFTRLMSTQQMGEYSNISSWVQVLLPLVSMELYSSVKTARFDYEDEFDRYNSSIAVYSAIIAAMFYGIVLCNMAFFKNLFSLSETSIHFIFIYMMFRPALSIYQAMSNIRYRYKISVLISISATVFSLGLGLLFVSLLENKVTGRLIGGYGTYIVLCILCLILLLAAGKGVSLRYLRYSIKISFPMVWHILSMHVLSSCDRIIIRRIVGPAATALYSVSYTCSHVVSVLYHALSTAWSPWAIAQMHEGNIQKMKAASRIYVLAFCSFVFVLMLVCPELLWIMGGDKYMEAKHVMPPAMLAVVPQFIYALYWDAEFYLKKQKRIAFGTILTAIINLILNLIFIPIFGYIAAAYTTLIGYLCLFLFHSISVILLGKGSWFNNRFHYIVVGLSLLVIPIANFLYDHNVLRYVCLATTLAAGFIVLYKYREPVRALISYFLGHKKGTREKST